ncbi:MAG: NAD(P)H-binding protein [Stackebrandtia sp.]
MTNNNENILIVGGTGKTGRRVARQLTAKGHSVRVASRSTSPRLDLRDESTWDAVLDGVDAVYIAPPDDPFPVEEFVDRAVKAGVRRLVSLSGRRIQLMDREAQTSMARTQNALRGSGAEWTVLQANNFNQNFSEGDYRDMVAAGELSFPLGDTREPVIDAEDIAEVAAVVLTTDGHSQKVYELTGPRGLTFTEIAAEIGKATGRSMSVRDVTPEQHEAELREAGFPEELIGFLNAMYEFMRSGAMAEPTDHVRRVLGREPADFADWAAKAAAEGALS